MAKRITYSLHDVFKGTKLPTGAVKVDRSTKYGNPFKVEDHGRDHALHLYEIYLDYVLSKKILDIKPLFDKDLACSCKPDERCHADILLERIERIR